MKQRLLNWLISVDQFIFSTITLGYSSPDETLSAAAYRTEKKDKILGKLFRPCIDFLFILIEKDHCYNAYMAEIRRTQLPEEYKNKTL